MKEKTEVWHLRMIIKRGRHLAEWVTGNSRCQWLQICDVDCSELSVSSAPAAVKHRITADKAEQTKPDDPKFVGRLKTLNLGASRKSRRSKTLGLLNLFFFRFILLLELSSTSANYCV